MTDMCSTLQYCGACDAATMVLTSTHSSHGNRATLSRVSITGAPFYAAAWPFSFHHASKLPPHDASSRCLQVHRSIFSAPVGARPPTCRVNSLCRVFTGLAHRPRHPRS